MKDAERATQTRTSAGTEPGRDGRVVKAAWEEAREAAAKLGLSPAHRLALAWGVRELARRIALYPGRWTCAVLDDSVDFIHKIRIVFEGRGAAMWPAAENIKENLGPWWQPGLSVLAANWCVDECSADSGPSFAKIVLSVRQAAFPPGAAVPFNGEGGGSEPETEGVEQGPGGSYDQGYYREGAD